MPRVTIASLQDALREANERCTKENDWGLKQFNRAEELKAELKSLSALKSLLEDQVKSYQHDIKKLETLARKLEIQLYERDLMIDKLLDRAFENHSRD